MFDPTVREPTLAQRERTALAETLAQLGPYAPTVLPRWEANDLLEHLLMRERAPHLMAATMIPGGLGQRVHERGGPWREMAFEERVRLFKNGPPAYSPIGWVDRLANASEHVVHHEDLLRAQAEWDSPRNLGSDADTEIWQVVTRMARVLVRVPVDVTLVAPQGGMRLPALNSRGSVRVHGDPLELLLWSFGRDRNVHVKIKGDHESLENLASGSRGV